MLNAIFRSIFGTKHERDVKRMSPIVAEIGALEPGLKTLSDEALRARTAEFRQRLADGAELDDLLPEAFAAARDHLEPFSPTDGASGVALVGKTGSHFVCPNISSRKYQPGSQ